MQDAAQPFVDKSRSPGPSPEEIRAALDRLLASPALPASPRRRALLRFLVEETLAGRAERLKGYAVAVAVFGRDESFDPQSDPIVRLEARHLRRDLDSYYVAAGAADPLRIAIPKGGYAPQFAWAGGEAPAAPAAEPAAEEAPAPEHGGAGAVPPLAPRRVLAAAAALLPLLLLGLWLWPASRPETRSERGPAVIVLPFEPLSAREEDRFLASGVTQEVITDLMRFAHFRVYSAPASFRQDGGADPRELRRELEVSYVVKGSLRSDAGAVRLGAQLFDAETGRVLWSETYDRELTPGALLEIQSELAAHIATALGQPYGVVQADMTRRVAGGAEPSMPSYGCVLRAYAYRRSFETALYAPTLACLEAAAVRDPDYPAIWAMLGWLRLDGVRFHYVPAAETKPALDRALDAAERAVALDGASVLGLQALSSILHYAGRFEESERVQRAALALNPNDPDTLAQLGWRLAARGDFDGGIPYLEQAIERSVSPPGWYFHLVAIHRFVQGDYRGMLDIADRSAVDGSGMSWSFIAIAQAALGDGVAARQALARMAEISPELAADPAAEYRLHGGTPEIVAALVAGLRRAGWSEPAHAGPTVEGGSL